MNRIRNILLYTNGVLLLLFPTNVVFGGGRSFRYLAERIVELLNEIALLVTGLAFVFFVISVIRFMVTAGDDASRAQGKQMLVWGTISLFAMVSLWGIVWIIQNTFFGN